MGRAGCYRFLPSVIGFLEQYSAGSAWRGNRRMTRLRRHPAAYCLIALTRCRARAIYSNKF
ncbi:hypothetical protein EB259_21435 [Salmonella enterica]|nr:hypothetical protein [Salmonella enterica]EBE4963548.1 hypothetical protein [Salmonella enterica]EBT5330245.1 hypothetical protein [Salmonella enterica]ECH4618053.1 hypothetical protein [Salmonella enterica]MDJ43519.1 hypothetical protein [Salmonella enterica]